MQQYLDRHRFLKGIYLMVRRYFDHHVGRDSAALTYYLLFALFPLLIFLSNLVGIMSVDISGFLYEIRAFIPQEALEIIEQYFTYVSRDSSPRLLWFSLIFSIYFPYRAASSLLGSVRRAYGEHRPTQFLRYQLKLLLYTLSLILMVVLSIGLSVVGGRVRRTRSRMMPPPVHGSPIRASPGQRSAAIVCKPNCPPMMRN